MSELKPNPFCGHPVIRDFVANDQWRDITGTESDTCGMCDEIFRMSDEDWNRRPIEDALRARVERLKAALKYYANPAVWNATYDGVYDCSWASIELDKGNIARAALEGGEHGDA